MNSDSELTEVKTLSNFSRIEIGIIFAIITAVVSGAWTISGMKSRLDTLNIEEIQAARDAAISEVRGESERIIREAEEKIEKTELPKNTIIAWTPANYDDSGLIKSRDDIVSVVPDSWVICGDKGTPNLNDRFLIGVKNPSNAAKFGGLADIPTDGDHSHEARQVNTNQYRFGNDNADDHYHTNVKGSHDHGGDNRPPFYKVVFLCKHN